MSTHAAIIAPRPEGGWQGIYVHHDGYPEHTGRMLARHYCEGDAARAIVALGDLSFLGPRLEPAGDEPELERTEAYHRDRGEALKVHFGESVEDLAGRIGGSHIYVWNGAGWICDGEDLDQVLAKLEEEDRA